MTETEKYEKLTGERVEKLILRLAAPTVLSMLIRCTIWRTLFSWGKSTLRLPAR